MPLMRCSKDGKSGWKWGEQGTCFVGDYSKQKATDQAIAILRSMGEKRGLSGADLDNYIKRGLEEGE